MIEYKKIMFADNWTKRLVGIYPYCCKATCDKEFIVVLWPCNDIHSAFLTKNLDIAFFNRDNVAIKIIRNLKPWKRVKIKEAKYVVERFSDNKMPWFVKGEVFNVKDLKRGR